MTNALVTEIRIKLASGLYDEGQVFLGLSGRITKEQFEGVVDYSLYPEIRSDIAKRIKEVVACRKIYNQYQENLRKEVVKAEAAELSGVKYSGFHDNKRNLDEVLKEKLKEFTTVSLEELHRF